MSCAVCDVGPGILQAGRRHATGNTMSTAGHGRARQGPTAAVPRTIRYCLGFPVQDSGPNTGRARQGRAPSEILQVANLGVGHRMQRRNRHTTDDMARNALHHNLGNRGRAPAEQSPGRPPRASQRRIGPSDASRNRVRAEQGASNGQRATSKGQGAGSRVEGGQAFRAQSTTHGTACDSTSPRAIRQVMARHVPPAPTHRERRPCASCHHAGPRLLARTGQEA